MDADQHLFFIIVDKGNGLSNPKPGRICWTTEGQYLKEIDNDSKIFRLRHFGSYLESSVHADQFEPLTEVKAGFLQALSTDELRLDSFLKKDDLEAAEGLTTGSLVYVEVDGTRQIGVVRYIGDRSRPTGLRPPLQSFSGTFFRVELQETGNEVWKPFLEVKPVSDIPVKESDRVVFFPANERQCRRGMVIQLEEKNGKTEVLISTDNDEQGEKGGAVTLPLSCVLKEVYLPTDAEPLGTDSGMSQVNGSSICLNSRVRMGKGTPKLIGTVRWLGYLQGQDGIRVGLELDTRHGVCDGKFQDVRYFTCPDRHGIFAKLSSCSLEVSDRDQWHNMASPTTKHTNDISWNDPQENEMVPPISSEDVHRLLVGRMKGVQGHCNSCYMDSALLSLFACSSVLDSMLLKPASIKEKPIQRTLLLDIVNPLRRHGFVEAPSIMRLRQQLLEGGYCPTFTTDEKDPEEFLSLIMNKILCLEPPIKLCSLDRVQTSFCYQIFLDDTHDLILPTVQQLLEQSFHCGHLKLAEAPSCLMLQMPRFGKGFKMFQKIVPSLELDITGLLSDGPQQCLLCGGLAFEECGECFKDSTFGKNGFKYYCQTCFSQVHKHPSRSYHTPSPCHFPLGLSQVVPPPRDIMELFAVLCIDTSHYVSFLKYGPHKTDWAFFDSMADREGEFDGYNIPEVRLCPEVARYLDMPLTELTHIQPKEMDELAKRLFCDAYMYLYQSPRVSLYH